MNFESVIDSKLGQTAHNISDLFTEMCQDPRPQKSLYLFDEIDSIAMDRVNSRGYSGNGQSHFCCAEGLDRLPEDIVLIAYDQPFPGF